VVPVMIDSVGIKKSVRGTSRTMISRRTDWLLKFMRDKQPKFLTKEELRHAAMRELKVSQEESNSRVAMIGMNRFAADIAPKANRGQQPGRFFPRCLMLRTEAICRLRDR
jgi:hypothetical protein